MITWYSERANKFIVAINVSRGGRLLESYIPRVQ